MREQNSSSPQAGLFPAPLYLEIDLLSRKLYFADSLNGILSLYNVSNRLVSFDSDIRSLNIIFSVNFFLKALASHCSCYSFVLFMSMFSSPVSASGLLIFFLNTTPIYSKHTWENFFKITRYIVRYFTWFVFMVILHTSTTFCTQMYKNFPKGHLSKNISFNISL